MYPYRYFLILHIADYGFIDHLTIDWPLISYQCDCLYVTVHTQAQQSYVTVHSLLRYGSHTHFLPGLLRENNRVGAI